MNGPVRIILKGTRAVSFSTERSEIGEQVKGANARLCAVSRGQVAASGDTGVAARVPLRVARVVRRTVRRGQRAHVLPIPVRQTEVVDVADERAQNPLEVIQICPMPWKKIPRLVNVHGVVSA